jgi:hypothetical protein
LNVLFSSNLLEVESFKGRIDTRKLFVFDAFAINSKAGTVVRHKHGCFIGFDYVWDLTQVCEMGWDEIGRGFEK